MDNRPPIPETVHEIDLSGRQLAGYRILRRLGRGAMAEVYLAEQVSLGRQVAFKVLKSDLATDATYVDRFAQEARAAARLVHANIVQIYEVGRADGIHFITQEYVQGQNLSELLARKGPPGLSKSLTIIRQVAAALAKAGEHGIVHRDIKPENIMLGAAGDVKVADFGLARLYDKAQADSSLTQVGMTMGTPLYMSPEQVEGRPLDPRSDIYSLGVTSYQMFAGEPPFRGETALAIAVHHLKTPPSRLENLRPDLPSSVARVVHKMLAKNPDDRYDNARQLLQELRTVSLELFPDELAEDLPSWGDDNPSGFVEARRQATTRLASAMKKVSQGVISKWAGVGWAAAIAVCLLVGFSLAWFTRELPLIAPASDAEEAVTRFDTAEAQYVYASMLNTAAGWKGVADYYPDDKTYTPRALERLALLYLQEYDLDEAMTIFEKFAAMNDAEVQAQAFGLAGEAIVLNRQGKSEDSVAKLVELWPLREHLRGEMRSLVTLFMQSNRRALGDRQTRNRWATWLNESTPEPTPRVPPSKTGDPSPEAS